jgi:hypothetical protein
MIRPLYILFTIAAAIIVVKLLYMASRRIGLQWVLTLLFVLAVLGMMMLSRGVGPRPPVIGWETRMPPPASPVSVPPPPSSTEIRTIDDARLEYEVAQAEVGDGSTHVVQSRYADQEHVGAHTGAAKSVVTRLRKTVSRYEPEAKGDEIVWTLVMGAAIAIFLYLAYLFLDAGTRGHFTWQLRIISVLAFVAVCVAIAALRDGL